MSEDEAPSSPDSDILFSNAFEDVDEGNVEINLDFSRQMSDEFDIDQPKRKKSRKSSTDKNEAGPTTDKGQVVENVSVDGTVGTVSDILGIPDSPENMCCTSTRRGRYQTRCQARAQQLRTRLSSKRAAVSSISALDSVVIDDDAPPSPVGKKWDSIFNESLSRLSGDEVLEDSEPELTSAPPEDNPNSEVNVRVIWKGGTIHPFTIRKKLKEIFTFFARQESLPEDRIMLVMRDKRISPDDSPHSIGTLSFIEGGVIDEAESVSAAVPHSCDVDADSLELKVQQKGIKEKHVVRISRTDKMAVFMSKLAEDLELPLSRMKFMFDGEPLEPSDTPESLDLEGVYGINYLSRMKNVL